MKTIILTVFAVSFTMVSYSQEIEFNGFSKGDFIISGSANFYSNENISISTSDTVSYKYENTNVSIIPEIGFFITDHFMLGVKAGYINSKSNRDNNIAESKNSGYTTGITGRYYFSPKKRFSFYTEISGSFSKIDGYSRYYSGEVLNSNYDDTRKDFSVKLSPGVNIFINKNFSITSRLGELGYSYSKDTFNDKLNNIGYVSDSKAILASLDFDTFYFGILYRI